MLTNGFALYRGDGAAALARKAATRVNRYADEKLLVDLEEKVGLATVALAYSLEKEGRFLPLVHGCVDDENKSPEGEFCLVRRTGTGFRAMRDSLGTRGLWVLPKGTNAGSVASDYRMLPDGAILLPPGSVYEGETAKRARATRKARRPLSAGDFDDAAKVLASLIQDSVGQRIRGRRRVAVSFSGGLDSSLLALVASRYSEVVLCSAYASGSRDEVQTELGATLLGLRLETAILDEKAVAKKAREAELPPGEATVMDEALWCIYSTASELAAHAGARTILLGQLADELFGGYRKYSERAHEEGEAAAERMMREDVEACAERGFLRDEAACSSSCEARFPYADARIASFAASLPFGYKVKGSERKAILRAAALKLGLPEELAVAPKKAAQYSSGTAKLLLRR